MSTRYTASMDLIVGAKIPLRDGIRLNATIYKPKTSTPIPAVFTLTPYISDTYHERANYFAQHGYAYVLVDARGRGSSEGEFDLPMYDGPDGYDIVEWLASQPWCDGQVTMWGGSFAGMNQLHTLKTFPPHLATIVPAAAHYWPLDSAFTGPIHTHHAFRYLTLTSGKTVNWNLFYESSFWMDKYREFYFNHLPYSELDSLIGYPSNVFQNLIRLKPYDPAVQRFAWSADELRRINIPILNIVGQYDNLIYNQIEWCRLCELYGDPDALAKHFIIIGPWDHAGTRTPQRDIGGWRFGEACLLNMNQLHTEWYDWTMKGGPKPAFLQKRVAYYVTGAETWKYADSLAAVSSGAKRLYLNSVDGQANDIFNSGSLDEAPPATAQPDHFVYDPLDTRPGEIDFGMAGSEIKNYIIDQRYALNLMGNGLVYHTAPLTQDIEITGTVKLVVWLAMDVPDTDLDVILAEILPDGRHVKLTDASLRARYREGLGYEKLVPLGEIVQYEFKAFLFISRLIRQGSRLRLVINCPNNITQEKNYNSGGDVIHETAKDARVAHISLFHDAEHPSYLELPLGADSPGATVTLTTQASATPDPARGF